MSDARLFRNIRGCTVIVQLDHEDGRPCLSLATTRDSDGLEVELRMLCPQVNTIGGLPAGDWWEITFAAAMQALTAEQIESVLSIGNVFLAFDIVDGKAVLNV